MNMYCDPYGKRKSCCENREPVRSRDCCNGNGCSTSGNMHSDICYIKSGVNDVRGRVRNVEAALEDLEALLREV